MLRRLMLYPVELLARRDFCFCDSKKDGIRYKKDEEKTTQFGQLIIINNIRFFYPVAFRQKRP
jgi:hypothetical protein